MCDQESYAPRMVSRRGVAAAWICCALAAFAGALAVGSSSSDVSRRSAYAGVHLPGRDITRSLDSRDDDDFDDEIGRVVMPPELTQPLLCSVRENPLHATAKLPNRPAAPSQC